MMNKFSFKTIALSSLALFTLFPTSCKKESTGTPETFTLTYSAGPGGTVTGLLTQQVEIGESGTEVVAVANDGKAFTMWSDGNTNPNRTDTDVQGDISVVANFGHPLYVAVDGNDAVTYAENTIDNPWATPEKAWREAKAGDVVYFREGTYTSVNWIETRLYGNDGTAEKPITFTSFPGEKAILDWPSCVSGSPFHAAISIHKQYNHIHNLEIKAAFPSSTFGGATFYIHAPNTKITCSTIQLIEVPQPDNSAPIVFYAGSNYGEVSNCKVIGFNTIRSSGIHMFRSVGMLITNNDISNCVHGIYLKHSNLVTDIPSNYNYFENNYIHDCTDGIIGVPNRTFIRNNLLVNCFMSFGSDGGMGDGYVGADYNTIMNNTLYNGVFELIWAGRPLSEDPNAGCMHNRIENNIIMGDACRWHGYSIPAPNYDYGNITNYNLYPDKGANLIKENNLVYSLSEWKIRIKSLYNRDVDNNSIIGNPTFVGGANPTTIEGFALTNGSAGKGVGIEGKDIGADVSKVGIK